MTPEDTTREAGASVPSEEGEEERRRRAVALAFGGDERRYAEFCDALRAALPPTIGVVLRGSAVTGRRWSDGSPFDADGSGTSDLDLTLVGSDVLGFFRPTGFFVPGVHSRPVSEDDPDIAPLLTPLRDQLMGMVKRPVNIQASREIVIQFRGDLLDQPYLVLFEKPKGT
jgi:hypothetical protein